VQRSGEADALWRVLYSLSLCSSVLPRNTDGLSFTGIAVSHSRGLGYRRDIYEYQCL